MLPALKLGPLTLYSYGILMALGVALGLWFLYVQGKKQGLSAPRVLDAAFYILLISILGAKLILLFSDFGRYIRTPRELLNLARSGGVFQGGLLFGVLFALWYFRKHKLPTWKMGDLIGPALALGHGFGRVGCFLAGCCYGRTCALPWGVTFNDPRAGDLTGIPLGIERHPVQLYESALNFVNFLVLFVILRRKTFDGQVFSFYIINYSVIRYFTEFFRGDHPAQSVLIQGRTALTTLTWPQFFCILGLAAGVVLYLLLKKRHAASS
ncbi:MAG: prolipoprotein diacylglyceryl transferase [Candidatus Aminicenantes bacterium]|nr:prolipoprotein diacylglyceryl transferase [Candidatus Aminicenantes bacterium]